MPSYTLYYFNARGRAEICRLLFAAADVQYTDKRIEFNEWSQLKNKMPGSMLPVLEIDGKQKWPQTMAIARFLAREFGFYPKMNLEMAKVDYICDCFYEILCDWLRSYYEKDSSKKAEWQRRFEDTSRRILPFLEKTLEMNNGGNGWFVGSQMYLCDMMCYTALENPLRDDPNMLNSCPKLLAHRTRVATNSRISAYLKNRVASDF